MSENFYARRPGRGPSLVALGMSFILSVPAPSIASQDTSAIQQPKEPAGGTEAAIEPVEISAVGDAIPALEDAELPIGAAGGTFLDEVEPNDTTATAQDLPDPVTRVRAQIFREPFVAGDIDVDIYKFTAPAGARVYAALMTSFSSGTTDSALDIIDVDGTTVLETDLDDGSFSGSASNVGGTLLATGGTYFVRVRNQTAPTGMSGRIAPYDLYVRVLTGAPAAEVEPNNSSATATPLPASGWASGTVDPAADIDWFSFTANAGDTIIAIVDADPERDTPDWNPRLGLGIFNNFFLTVDGSVVGDATPSEAFLMTVKNTGTYYAVVDASAAAGGATFTYNVAAFVIPAKVRTCTTFTGTTGPITDAGTTNFTVNVPTPGIVGYARVGLTATHPTPGDLDVTLIGPDGNEVFLFDDLANNAVTPPQFNLKIEDEAAIPFSVIFSGMHYIPELAGRMEYFKGMQQQGTWTLRVRDDALNNTGTVDAFSIDVCEPAPRPACLVPGPQENTIYTSDFEASDGGFTHAGTLDEWERGLPSFAPITTAHSGTNAWKTDLDNTYENNSNQDLISPPIDLTAATGRVTLTWWQKLNLESASFDNYWVEVRQVGNPASARKVHEWTGSTMTRSVGTPAATIQQSAGWAQMQADISSFVGQIVEARFHLNTDTSVQMTGVAIDDVLISSCTTLAEADLAIIKTNNQTTYFPGQAVTYTIVASNSGPAPVVDASVTDAFPAELTSVTWTCVASAGSACGAASGSGNISELVDLLPGGTVTYTVSATVSTTATGPIVNTATIAPPAGLPDPNAANNSATDTDQFLATAPVALAVDTAGNNVYQPNETVEVEPTWRNLGAATVMFTGGLTNHVGPAGATYFVDDPMAVYGPIAGGSTGSCSSTGDCYVIHNVLGGPRPSVHWDSTADELINPASSPTKTWTLHIGDSFADVPASNPFYRFIEILLHRGITGGCSATDYCPGNTTNREQMAVFVLLAKEGPSYSPAPCVAGTEQFLDVPASSPFCKWIEELFDRGVVAGCGGGNYCPTNPVNREQMSVFVLRTLDPGLTPPPCVPPNLYLDVPETSPFCPWIEELTNRGVVAGCGGGNYCPSSAVTREQMGVFIGLTFALTLYGV